MTLDDCHVSVSPTARARLDYAASNIQRQHRRYGEDEVEGLANLRSLATVGPDDSETEPDLTHVDSLCGFLASPDRQFLSHCMRALGPFFLSDFEQAA